MTEKQVINYLYVNENRKTWNEIIKKIGSRSYEELKEIYDNDVLKMLRDDVFCREGNTREKYIYLSPNGTYQLNITNKKINGTFKTLEDAVKARNEALGGI